MPIGRRSRHRLRADDPARASLVVHDNLLPDRLGKLEGDHAADDVVAAAWREWDDEPHRLRWIGLRGRMRGMERGCKQRERQAECC